MIKIDLKIEDAHDGNEKVSKDGSANDNPPEGLGRGKWVRCCPGIYAPTNNGHRYKLVGLSQIEGTMVERKADRIIN